MGGWGSGSYYRIRKYKRTAENSLPLDVRKLKRHGCLTPGRWFFWQWSTGDNVHSSIGATVYKDHLLLKYTHKKTEDVEQKIYFDWTPCYYGSERVWFRCPFCGRRCAIIYIQEKYFTCRLCCGLTYQTCNETPRDRRFSKANKLRKRLGAKPGAFHFLPYFKPKGMHQTTWVKIKIEIKCLEAKSIAELFRMMGV